MGEGKGMIGFIAIAVMFIICQWVYWQNLVFEEEPVTFQPWDLKGEPK